MQLEFLYLGFWWTNLSKQPHLIMAMSILSVYIKCIYILSVWAYWVYTHHKPTWNASYQCFNSFNRHPQWSFTFFTEVMYQCCCHVTPMRFSSDCIFHCFSKQPSLEYSLFSHSYVSTGITHVSHIKSCLEKFWSFAYWIHEQS